jgi:hypothetical protein
MVFHALLRVQVLICSWHTKFDVDVSWFITTKADRSIAKFNKVMVVPSG